MVDELILINQGKIIKQCTMAELNQTAQDFIVISTTNDQAARTILTDAGYPLEDPDKIKLLKKRRVIRNCYPVIVCRKCPCDRCPASDE